MKKIVAYSVFMLTIATLASANGFNPRVLVVYYSREGHTKLVAEKLASRFNADLERLIDKKDRVGPLAVMAAGRDALNGSLTEIGPLTHDPLNYDIVLVGTPSWFGNVTPAVRTFLSQYRLLGKTVGLFGTAHLTGVEHALEETTQLIGPPGTNFPRLPLRHRDLSDATLREKIEIFHKEVMDAYQSLQHVLAKADNFLLKK